MKRPNRIDFSPEEIEGLMDRLENQRLDAADFSLLADLIRAMVWMENSLKEKKLSIRRLRSIFGIKTESAQRLSKFLQKDKNKKGSGSNKGNGDKDKENNGDAESENPKGHGHRPADDYQEAEIIPIAHESLQKGSICPECNLGRLFHLKPGTVLRIVGQPWLNIQIYKPERLRCSACQKIFTAKLPQELHTESRADKTAKSIVSILKYRGGMPFYRQEQLQSILGNPISNSEVWEMTRDVANSLEPIFVQLCQIASTAECIHNDDTTAKILEQLEENKTRKKRTGIFTTALLAKKEERQIALFFTGRQHAGENLSDILDLREDGEPPPIQCCDGLSRNLPKDHPTLVAYCNVHARRKFYELASCWKEESLKVIASFGTLFLNDSIAKREGLNPEERLKWHQKHSAPLMKSMLEYCQELIYSKKVEPNSSFGKAIRYLEKYWEGLTLFLRIPGVPLSNNEDEQLIKRAVLNRKNAYFFKTESGAKLADIIMSGIETCVLNQVNPYHYLIAIQENEEAVFQNPAAWLPWNYKKA